MTSPIKKARTFFLTLAAAAALCGCDTLRQFTQAATFARCQFRLVSVEGTTLAGIPIQGVTSVQDIGFMNLARFQSAFSQGALPLEFTLNLEVKNPNASAAAMNKLEWILFLDGTQLTSGLLERRVVIPAQGGTGTLPLAISLDLLKVLSGKTLDSMINLALNIAGEGNKPSRITLQAKPSILVEG